jgi:hypothetical protein
MAAKPWENQELQKVSARHSYWRATYMFHSESNFPHRWVSGSLSPLPGLVVFPCFTSPWLGTCEKIKKIEKSKKKVLVLAVQL